MNFRLSAFAVASLALATTARAQTPVHWTATANAKSAAAGSRTSVKLSATIEDGWHIYSLTQGPGGPFPTRITIPDRASFALGGKIKAVTPPKVAFDDNFGINVETHEKAAEFVVPVKITKSTKPGAQTLPVSVRYQVCNTSMCLPPQTEKLSVDLNVKRQGK